MFRESEMRWLGVAVVTGLMTTTSSVLAADQQTTTTLTPTVAAAATSLAQRPDLASTINLAAQFKMPRRPMPLSGLYAGSAFLQGYDAYSTLSALKSGATEANPLIRGITKNPAAFVALKAGVTAASIMGAERLRKDNHRTAAILMMIASNGMMAAVAAHNSAVLHRVR
jgi:Domain of unknown function (DUF5658)